MHDLVGLGAQSLKFGESTFEPVRAQMKSGNDMGFNDTGTKKICDPLQLLTRYLDSFDCNANRTFRFQVLETALE